MWQGKKVDDEWIPLLAADIEWKKNIGYITFLDPKKEFAKRTVIVASKDAKCIRGRWHISKRMAEFHHIL